MKRLCFFIFFLLLFFLPKPVLAQDENWIIEQFVSDLTIERTGEVTIIESIAVDFNALQKHGIYRDIPYVYEKDGIKTYTELSVKEVKQNGSNAEYKVTRNDGYVRIRIGDPDKTISGRNVYHLTYVARGVLRGFEGYDELYWNVTGNGWEVPIIQARARVSLPEDGLQQIICFEGYEGSTAECTARTVSDRVAEFYSTASLEPAKGLSFAIAYKKGMVPLLTVERPKSFLEKFLEIPSIITLLTIASLGVGGLLFFWYKNGRDYWFGKALFGQKDQAGVEKPIGAHETVVVEYTSPEQLRPAEIGVLMDERAHTTDIVATIIDLASRGYLTITEKPKTWLFGKTDYILSQKDKPTHDLLAYEKLLLSELFQDGKDVSMSSLKTTFYDELDRVKKELYKEVVRKKLFVGNPDEVRNNYLIGAVFLLIIGGAGTVFSISNEWVYLADIAIGIAISGVIALLLANFMPRRTAYGRDLYRRARGYYLFINTAEKHRQQFFEKKNLFHEVLPYAIMFGLTAKFAQAMKDIGFKPTKPGWYTGSHAYNMAHFSSSMSDFSKSMSTAMASTPSKGGGFSGGSSGGGFGGGGGGSW